MKIKLTRGYEAEIDDEDYERISRYLWTAVVGVQVRAARQTMRKQVYLHHEVLRIMPWELNGKEVDHIDRNPLNNRKDNLRLVTREENMRNTERHLFRKGYCYNKRAKLWTVYLDVPGGKRKYLGYTKTEEEAIQRAAEARNAYNTNA